MYLYSFKYSYTTVMTATAKSAMNARKQKYRVNRFRY